MNRAPLTVHVHASRALPFVTTSRAPLQCVMQAAYSTQIEQSFYDQINQTVVSNLSLFID